MQNLFFASGRRVLGEQFNARHERKVEIKIALLSLSFELQSNHFVTK